jgi:glycosyltransferase involved in cell wall biosynthesis
MKILFFANRMPDLCGAFLHDIDLATELQRRGHSIVFLTITVPKEGFQGGHYRGFRFMNFSAGGSFLDTSDIWICPHAPVLPDVRKLNGRGYNRPIIATCHYDGNYTTITRNAQPKWAEMLMFINSIMEPNYRKNIVPFPPAIVRTEVIRPIMHRDKIMIDGPFRGDAITLVNANQNKGIHVFLELAKRMPDRKFLGVLPYYGELQVPMAPHNVEWVPFNDDIRTVLRRTRILLFPSFYESFGRIAVEAMINGIPVLYSKPAARSPYPGGSMEAVKGWIGDAAIACEREKFDEWTTAIESLDDEDTYQVFSQKSKDHIESMNLFTEATRIASIVESFSREHPVVIRSQAAEPSRASQSSREPPRLREPVGPGGFGVVNGRLRIQR